MKWKDLVYRQIVKYCNQSGCRTFSLGDLFLANEVIFRQAYPNNRFPRQKLCEMMQKLRNDGLITFLGNSGNYTLRGVELLDAEREEIKAIDISHEVPEKREYIVETYVRNVGWARRAKDIFGNYCLCVGCTNTFVRDDGAPYIEVHHIVPLCRMGEDSISNLCVLCAHHHKMAHFADHRTRTDMEAMLSRITNGLLIGGK